MKKLILTLLVLLGAVLQVNADKTLKITFKDGVKSTWMPAPATGWCGIWAFKSGEDGSWYDLTDENDDGTYEASIPDAADTWTLAYGHDDRKWDNKTAQTGDIAYGTISGFTFKIESTDNGITLGNGITKIISSPKDFKFNFATGAEWTKDGDWIGVWAWKDGEGGVWYNPGTPTDGIYTVSIPDVADYWMLVRGHGTYNEETNWANKDNQSAAIPYKNGNDYLSTFTAIGDDYVPTSSIIFNARSIIGNLTGNGTFDLGQEVDMTQVSPDISWLFDAGQKINVKFAIEPTAEYHAYKFDNWEWNLLPGQSREDINADGWVTIVVNSDIQEAVKGAEGKGFRIHGYGLYVEKVTKGDTPDTDVADDILWEGHHYLNWNAFNDLCANKEWGNSNRYMLTFDKTLTAGTYEYKMIVNHKWGVYELPSSGNQSFTFNEAGKFRLTFTADFYENKLVLEAEKYVSVGTSGFSTFSSKHSVNFAGQKVKAYRAEINGENKVVLKKVEKIPSNTGVMLIGDPNDAEVAVPFTSGSDFNKVTNKFVATDGESDIAKSNGTNSFNYVFSSKDKSGNDNPGFYELKEDLPRANVKVGGAYLHTETALAAEAATSRVGWIIDGDDTTGINQIENVQPATVQDGAIYNLNGQRVMNPAKGLYIVNGKKVIIK